MMISRGKFRANFNAIGGIRNGSEQWRGQWHIYDASTDSGEPIEKGDCTAWHVSRNDAQADARDTATARMKALEAADGS